MIKILIFIFGSVVYLQYVPVPPLAGETRALESSGGALILAVTISQIIRGREASDIG
jgi:hypothetical protein